MTHLTYRGINYVKSDKKFYVSSFPSFEKSASDSKKSQETLVESK
jgi:hypothetical protein